MIGTSASPLEFGKSKPPIGGAFSDRRITLKARATLGFVALEVQQEIANYYRRSINYSGVLACNPISILFRFRCSSVAGDSKAEKVKANRRNMNMKSILAFGELIRGARDASRAYPRAREIFRSDPLNDGMRWQYDRRKNRSCSVSSFFEMRVASSTCLSKTRSNEVRNCFCIPIEGSRSEGLSFLKSILQDM